MQIVALIHEGNGEFAATFPDLPGVIAHAASMEALLAEAARRVAAELDGMIEDGVGPPRLRSLAELAADPAFGEDSAGAMVALVPCTAPTDKVRVAIAIDRSLLSEIDRVAGAETRSAYIAEAIRQRLAAPEARSLEQPATAATAPRGSSEDVRAIMESIRRSLAAINRAPAR